MVAELQWTSGAISHCRNLDMQPIMVVLSTVVMRRHTTILHCEGFLTHREVRLQQVVAWFRTWPPHFLFPIEAKREQYDNLKRQLHHVHFRQSVDLGTLHNHAGLQEDV
jgi:hypothetical protein